MMNNKNNDENFICIGLSVTREISHQRIIKFKKFIKKSQLIFVKVKILHCLQKNMSEKIICKRHFTRTKIQILP